jgi:hypothetical protein
MENQTAGTTMGALDGVCACGLILISAAVVAGGRAAPERRRRSGAPGRQKAGRIARRDDGRGVETDRLKRP